MSQRLPFLYIADSQLGGRGVFTARAISIGDAIEVCPVIVIPPEELPVIHKTGLHDYYFLWEEDEKSGAIALGYGSLYNHSYQPNARYLVDFADRTINISCIRNIEAGEEITFNYNGDPKDGTLVWFDRETSIRTRG